jgi:hypothetical protein
VQFPTKFGLIDFLHASLRGNDVSDRARCTQHGTGLLNPAAEPKHITEYVLAIAISVA